MFAYVHRHITRIHTCKLVCPLFSCNWCSQAIILHCVLQISHLEFWILHWQRHDEGYSTSTSWFAANDIEIKATCCMHHWSCIKKWKILLLNWNADTWAKHMYLLYNRHCYSCVFIGEHFRFLLKMICLHEHNKWDYQYWTS